MDRNGTTVSVRNEHLRKSLERVYSGPPVWLWNTQAGSKLTTRPLTTKQLLTHPHWNETERYEPKGWSFRFKKNKNKKSGAVDSSNMADTSHSPPEGDWGQDIDCYVYWYLPCNLSWTDVHNITDTVASVSRLWVAPPGAQVFHHWSFGQIMISQASFEFRKSREHLTHTPLTCRGKWSS